MIDQALTKLRARRAYWCVLPMLAAVTALAQNDSPSNRPTLRTAPDADPVRTAADGSPVRPPDTAWKTKQIAEWTENDAKQVMADSPWVKTFTPTLGPASGQSSGARPRMGMGGINLGGISVGVPGMRRMGGGYPQQGGGYPGGQAGGGYDDLPRVTLRWESALPIRSAELKAQDNNAPVIDDKHYAIAVYGVPGRYLVGETKKLEAELKKAATLRRDGKKDIKPSSVSVIDKPGGMVVLYEFSWSNEITKEDHRVEFDAKMGRLELDQSFFLDDMVWEGKREL
jgi:hypothetical protein